MTPLGALDDQVDAYRRYAPRAFDALLARCTTERDHFIALGERRLIDGYSRYGSRLFALGLDDWLRDQAEELADGIVYGVPIEIKRARATLLG